jgi:putative tryptophan/tyrosine transport system substrate-binding protein
VPSRQQCNAGSTEPTRQTRHRQQPGRGPAATEFSIAGKWLELLKELKPSLKRVVQIANLENPNNMQFSKYIEDEGKTFGLDVVTVGVRGAGEIVPGIAATGPSPDTAVVVLPDSLLVINRKLIGDVAAAHRMPAIYPFRIFTDEGGLISYGLNFTDLYQQTAAYVDRILKGEKPGDLPIQAPTKFELIINMKVAKSIGIDVPPQLAARADEVIE